MYGGGGKWVGSIGMSVADNRLVSLCVCDTHAHTTPENHQTQTHLHPQILKRQTGPMEQLRYVHPPRFADTVAAAAAAVGGSGGEQGLGDVERGEVDDLFGVFSVCVGWLLGVSRPTKGRAHIYTHRKTHTTTTIPRATNKHTHTWHPDK